MHPTAPISIRLAEAADAPALATLLHGAFAEQRGQIAPESAALSETSHSIAQRFADHTIAVAEQAGRLVGCVFYRPDGDELYLGRLATAPEYRGQGIAAGLVAHVEAHARARGAGAVTLGVRITLTRNRRFFEARGYRAVGIETHPGFAEPTSIRYVKTIRAEKLAE